jgi:hypothetical protein
MASLWRVWQCTHLRIERGVIQTRRVNSGTPCWITLDEAAEEKLRDWVRNSSRIQKAILNSV